MAKTGGEHNINFAYKADNIYVIDTYSLGIEHLSSCYLVEGDEIALIDTGLPKQIDSVRTGIKDHGFSIKDISYIFITHCEHDDHAGNVGALVQENPRIKVYINPVGLEYLTDPSIHGDRIPPQVAAQIGKPVPVPKSNIEFLNDGDILDIGNGEKLSIIFTAGHQPGGLVIFEEKNNGLFSGDIVGDYFADADFLQVLTPPGSDVVESIVILKKFMNMPINKLYLGHFGICDESTQLLQRSLNEFQKLMDIAAQCVTEGKPEEIEPRTFASKLPELEKIRKTRGETAYKMTRGTAAQYSSNFAKYYLDLIRK
jgi:glyoxylase-like metal-dependent hydrolase (beta-lactamase superfamily II)